MAVNIEGSSLPASEASGSLMKGLMLLEQLGRSSAPMGVAQLGRTLGMSKGGVHRLLQMLRAAGWVRQTPEGTYECTLRIWEIGNRVIERTGLRRLALPHLKTLWEQAGETTYLAILDGDEALYLEKMDSPKRVLASFQVGDRLAAHRVAAGKAILAHVPESQSHPATGEGGEAGLLAKDLASIRERGFSVNNGELDASINGIAAPVFDAAGSVIASIGFSCPSERFVRENLLTLAPMVMKAAQDLSSDLGHVARRSAP